MILQGGERRGGGSIEVIPRGGERRGGGGSIEVTQSSGR